MTPCANVVGLYCLLVVLCKKFGGSPLDFVYTGNYNYNNGSLNNEGSNGNYWSRTANSGTNAYNLNFNSSNVNPQNNLNRGYGFALRCVGLSATSYPRFLPSLGDFVGKLVVLVIVEVFVIKAWESYWFLLQHVSIKMSEGSCVLVSVQHWVFLLC